MAKRVIARLQLALVLSSLFDNIGQMEGAQSRTLMVVNWDIEELWRAAEFVFSCKLLLALCTGSDFTTANTVQSSRSRPIAVVVLPRNGGDEIPFRVGCSVYGVAPSGSSRTLKR